MWACFIFWWCVWFTEWVGVLGRNWFGSLSHKMIAAFYFMVGLISGVVGFILSFFIRFELGISMVFIFTVEIAQVYNSIITVHGVVMIFFFIMPFLIGGVGNKEVVEHLFVSDFVLPRLNNMSYWFTQDALFVVLYAISMEESIGSGWTFYPPLIEVFTHSGCAVTLGICSLHLLGFSSEGGSINFIETTILVVVTVCLVLSLLVWVIAVTSMLLILSLPVLAAGITLLLLDREFGSVVFCSLQGGDCVLFQHLFWYFGHPEVYIIILPAFGVVSFAISIVVWWTVFGFHGMLYAILAIGVVGFCVWAHHMFTVGMSSETRIYYSSATMVISVPTAIKIFTWLTTLMFAELLTNACSYFILGFLLMFLLGGFTGLVLANSSLDIFLHDSYYVVGHFHFVLSLGAVFSVFIYFSLYSISLADLVIWEVGWKIVFVFLLFGVVQIFYPQHLLGLYSHPRRIYCYPDIFAAVNISINVGILVISLLLCWIIGFMFSSLGGSFVHFGNHGFSYGSMNVFMKYTTSYVYFVVCSGGLWLQSGLVGIH